MSEKETDGVGKLREAFDGCEGTRPAVGDSLGERAVACKHFRWLPGMLVLEVGYGGTSARLVCEDGQYWHGWAVSEDGGCWYRIRIEEMGRVPDLSDPATLGCLLALVREAWGKPVIAGPVNAKDDGALDWEAHILMRPIRFSFVWKPFTGATEAEALVKALEAAP